ncbi:hypothetical protein LY78DRAFT_4804 [Colletotrichum sublineola]|nr:hypothetical protein LY78DRAFT_4804 [Colletotrichum sublineola]
MRGKNLAPEVLSCHSFWIHGRRQPIKPVSRQPPLLPLSLPLSLSHSLSLSPEVLSDSRHANKAKNICSTASSCRKLTTGAYIRLQKPKDFLQQPCFLVTFRPPSARPERHEVIRGSCAVATFGHVVRYLLGAIGQQTFRDVSICELRARRG